MEIPDFSIAIVHDSIIVVVDSNKNLELSNYVINHILSLFKGSSLTYQNQSFIHCEIETLLYKLVYAHKLYKDLNGWAFVKSIAPFGIANSNVAFNIYDMCDAAFYALNINYVHLFTTLELEILHASLVKYVSKHYSHINECDLITQAHNLIFNKRTEHSIAYANSISQQIQFMDTHNQIK